MTKPILVNDTTLCPYCDSGRIVTNWDDDFERGEIGTDGSTAWEEMRCLDCRRKWTDCYVFAWRLDDSEDGGDIPHSDSDIPAAELLAARSTVTRGFEQALHAIAKVAVAKAEGEPA